MSKKVKVLFLCTGNSCRSQMAEAWARKLKKDTVEAWSAGVDPKKIDPRAVKVMAEVGIDIAGQSSKNVSSLMDVPFDYVITLCGHASETCPIFPGPTKKVHRGFEDPPLLARNTETEEEAMAHYRRIRDEIKDFVQGLPDNIVMSLREAETQ